MKKIIKKTLFVIYIFIALLVSFYLFIVRKPSNQKKHLIAKDLESFQNYSLLIIKSTSKVKVNDRILFYNFYTNKEKVLEGKVVEIEETENSKTYKLDNNRFVSDTYFIANLKDVKKTPIVGIFFLIFLNFWGYFFFILIPLLMIFIYLIISLYKEKKC